MPERMFRAFFGGSGAAAPLPAPMRYANTNLHSRAAITPVSADKSSNRIWIMVMLLGNCDEALVARFVVKGGLKLRNSSRARE
jgi:hypothetical protein